MKRHMSWGTCQKECPQVFVFSCPNPVFPPPHQCVCVCVWGIEPSTSNMLGKCPTTEPHPQSLKPVLLCVWSVLTNLVEKPSQACLFRFFLASLGSILPSRVRGRSSLERGGSYDLLLDKGRSENFFMASSKTKRQRKIMICLREKKF
jgi:hypothetical protein